MSIFLVNNGNKKREKRYEWGEIGKINISKSEGNSENFYLLNNYSKVMAEFLLDMNNPENVNFRNQLVARANENATEVNWIQDYEMMCPKCGNIISKNSVFCPKCAQIVSKKNFAVVWFVIISWIVLIGLFG